MKYHKIGRSLAKAKHLSIITRGKGTEATTILEFIHTNHKPNSVSCTDTTLTAVVAFYANKIQVHLRFTTPPPP